MWKRKTQKEIQGVQYEEDDSEKKYQFIREQIRPQRKRLVSDFIQRIAMTVLIAAIFGVVACLLASATDRFINGRQEAAYRKALAQKTASTEEAENAPITASSEPIQIESMEGYSELWKEVSEVGQKCNEAVVKVSSVDEKDSWHAESVRDANKQSGLVFRETLKNYYILTGTGVVSNAKKLYVTFQNNKQVQADIQGTATNLGVAVLRVDKAELDNQTIKETNAVSISEKSQLALGTPVLLLGSPNGVMNTVLLGNVVNNKLTASVTDGDVSLYSTNTSFCSTANGFAVDIEGRLVGMLSDAYQDVTGCTNSAFIGIHDISSVLTSLVQGKEQVYFGIKGCNLDKERGSQFDLEDGIYITDVIVQSPAYEGGVRAADILTAIDGTSVKNLRQMRLILSRHIPGDELTLSLLRTGDTKSVKKKIKVVLK